MPTIAKTRNNKKWHPSMPSLLSNNNIEELAHGESRFLEPDEKLEKMRKEGRGKEQKEIALTHNSKNVKLKTF